MTWENFRGFVPIKVVEKAIHLYINDIDHRTRREKEVEHIPCVDNLVFELANGRTLD